MTRADGTPVNAVFGFTNMLAKLLREHVGTHIAVIFDAGRTTFRNRLSADYKAHRPEPPPELIPQFALVRDATAAFGVAGIELADWEADDLIASYAREAVAQGGQVTIVSSDKDLMQLLGDGVGMLDPIKNKPIGPAEVIEKFGVPPGKLVEVQALMGDSVDNVPGVPGIGPKNAAQLIGEHGDLEGVLAAAPAMKPGRRRDMLIEHAEAARLSRRLVELCREVPLPQPLPALLVREPDREVLGGWLLDMGFRSTANRLGLATPDGRIAASPPAAPAQASLDLPVPAAEAFGDYACVTETETLAEWCAQATACGVVAIDVLASDPVARRARLVGISLAIRPGRACYVPLGHETEQAQLPAEEALAILAPLLADPHVLKVFQDAKADLMLLGAAGAPPVAPADDVSLISFALDAGRHGHGLEELSRLHLGHSPMSLDDATGTGRARLAVAHIPLDRATALAGESADMALRLWQTLRPLLRPARALALYEQVERRLTPVLLEAERAGIRVDEADLRAMSADFAARMAVMETEIHALAGRGVQSRQRQAARRGAVRPHGPARRQADEDRRLGHRRLGAAEAGRSGTHAAGAHPGMAAACKAEIDLRRRAGGRDRRRHRARPHQLRDGRHQHRPAVVQRPQFAEYPDPHRGGPAHPPRLRGRAGACAGELRLLADRAAPAGACRRHPKPCARAFAAARTSTRAPPARCFACRCRAWMRRRGGARRRSISASSTASARSAWGGSCRSSRRWRGCTSRRISNAIPASAPTWSARARRRGCTAMC